MQIKGVGRRMIKILRTVLIISTAITLVVTVYQYNNYKTQKENWENIPDIEYTINEDNITDIEPDKFPEDTLFIERDRAEYKDRDLRLIIPSMNINDDVMNGTSNSSLKHGPGLYDVAQIPRPGYNVNTSLAGHRAGYGRYGNLFKEIEELKENDRIYLVDKEYIYIYEYVDSKVVEPSDISVLYLQGFTCLTLTSCHPLGSNTQRIVVRAKLIDYIEYKEDYEYT